MDSHNLSQLYRHAHNRMRDIDGLQPQEAFDELLKFFLIQESLETTDLPYRKVTAKTLRQHFLRQINQISVGAQRLWQDAQLRLSDRTLLDLRDMFAGIQLTSLSLDTRSNALRTFLTPEIRRGLGIFLTPDEVARAMVQIAAPAPTETILDPACGSGTFLLETVRYIQQQRLTRKEPITLYGIDKNPRMILLAELNLARHQDIRFHGACLDSLRQFARHDCSPLDVRRGSVDLILTNPPFGVTVTRDTGTLDLFGLVQAAEDRVPSEALFLQLCLRMLRPGGRLGIVLPRSVLTNERLARHRAAIDEIGHLTDIIDLPTETFAATGTHTATVAAFFRKHQIRKRRSVSVRVSTVTNVGVDSTGREREGNQLPTLAKRIAEEVDDSSFPTTIYDDVSADTTTQRSAEFLFRRSLRTGRRTLQQFVDIANAGRTPSRSTYSDTGTFILKVGNLTGRGVDWTPRDRNFVSVAEGVRRARSKQLGLQMGDLLLTASAHASKYIAKKSDVLMHIPKEHKLSGLTFVGELIRVRPATGVDPFVLLAAIRHPDVRDDMQACVRGQTAHLNPSDMLAVAVPWDLRAPDSDVLAVADLLRQQARVAFQLSEISADIASRLAQR